MPTIDAMETFLSATAQFGNLYLSDDQEAAILDGVRSAGAEVLGSSSDAVAVVAGASEGLGQVTSLLEPDQGTVLLVGSDFPSVTYGRRPPPGFDLMALGASAESLAAENDERSEQCAGPSTFVTDDQVVGRTFVACGPFWPCVMSYSRHARRSQPSAAGRALQLAEPS